MIDCSLDTTALIDMMKGRRDAAALVGQFGNPGVSHVVVGELLLGGYKASDPNEKIKIIERLKGITILKADVLTADIYAQICFELGKQGNTIPTNDIWIAAITL
ncbi:MAG TPA: PIN domain-containing protein [Candidatus Methylacidiphilales bacterium]|jgi:predicted nucleic acid-binding protein|nr:PIN domain-containing protein [Candidatus Methylacidiphilales bacterium]